MLLTAPQFISVSPNVGDFLQDGAVRNDVPREFNFQFSPDQAIVGIDSTSLDAIHVIGAGHDGGFTPANVITDLGTNGAVLLRIGSQRLGPNDNGDLLTVLSVDRAGNGPTIVRTNPATDDFALLTLTLDSNLTSPTTAQKLIDFAKNDPVAKQLLTVSLVSAPITASTILGTPPVAPLTLNGAGAASALSSFGVTGLNVLFRANQPGEDGNGILIQVNKLDFGAASSAPTVNVVGQRIEVVLNENPAAPTTVQGLLNAINSSTKASLLVSASRITGSATANIAAGTTDGSLIRFAGADRVISASIASGFQSTNGLLVQFAAKLTGTAGNDVSLLFQQPQPVSSSNISAPTINVSGKRITVTLNNNPTARTTADDLITALGLNAAASALITAKRVSSAATGTTDITTLASGTVLKLGGVDAAVAPGFSGVQPSNRDVVYRFGAPLTNDVYRIEIIGTGSTPLTNNMNEPVNGDGVTLGGKDVFRTFTLDLGAVVTSVVPQPVLREQLLTVSNVARITDGDTLTVDPGNGTRLFVFEFNSGALNNIRPGNFEIPFTTLMTQAAVATAISTAINNATLASPDVVATATGATVSLVGGAFDVRAKLTLNPNASPVGLTLRAGAVIKQSLDQIQVYFNNDDLVDTATVAENPAFYQLINTKGTSSALDDTISLPMNVAYDANLDVATLTFSGNIPIGTFSLKIGSSQELDSTLLSAVKLGTLSAGPGFTRSAFTGDNGTGSADLDHYQFELPAAGDLVVTATPDAAHDTVIRLFNSAGASVGSAVLVNNAAGAGDTLTAVGLTAGTYYAEVGTSTTTTGSYLLNISTTAMLASSDKNSSYASASNLGSLGAAGATVVASIDSSLSIPVPPLPGDDTPGHRNIPAEAHGGGSGTTPATPGGIAVIRYNFADVYGFDPQGNILHNQITAGQKQRTREIFEIFSRYAGIQSEETANSGFQIVTGDLRALDPTIPVNSVAGLGGGSPIIINALGTLGSDDVYDGAWMSVAFHEIGHSLGLGHTTDLHSLQSGNGNSVTAETPTSDYDNQHLASLYSPFSNDIDLYKFTVSQAGRISAGIAAELQTPTSKLDSVLTLFRDPFATASSDFGTSGMTASSVNFTSAIAGTVGNSVRVIVLTNDVGGVGVPTVSVLGHDITLTLNTNLGNQTTASQVVAAINGNAAASLLLSASFTGADSNVTGIAPGSSTIALKGGNREQIARNDDYNSNDSLISVDLLPGTYYIGVSAKGNSGYDPTVADSGYGGQSEGAYRLNVSFAAAPASSLLDQDEPLFPATVLDGDADRIAGGQFAFWFESGNTIYVDKITSIPVAQQDGTLAKPFSTIGAAIKMASSRIVVPTTGAAGINDGDYFTINDGTNPTDVFEFDKLGDGVVASNRPIAINPGDTPAQVATKIATAINAERTLNRILSQATATNDHVDITNVTTLDASAAVALITAQNLVRILSNGGTDADRATAGDNTPYLIGVNNVGGTLADGRNFDVPQGVTVMVDAGTIIKLQSANIDVGTSAFGLDRRGGSVQLLGTPEHVGTGNSAVYLTSFRNDAVGGDSDGASAGVSPGQWGGLVFRHDSDMTISQNNDVFLNSVYQSDISYGGGQVTVNSVAEVFDPIHIISNRPTVAFSLITNSADAAISADPDSFDDSLDRIGPDVHGNLLFNNSINGLFVRIKTQFGAPVDKLNVRARFDDTDITHIITENLLITGNPGGSILSNEQQQLVVLGSPSGGTFTLSFSGGFAQPTTPLTKAVGVSALTQTVGSTTLSAAILTNLQTSITVSSLAGLPTADANPATIDFTISIGGEQMAVTNINVATRVLTVTRGINGTTRIATAAIGTAVLQTSFAVAAGNLFAVADGSAATIDFTVNIAGEQMAVTNVVGNVFTVTRAINGTTAANHSIGNTVLQTSLAVSNAANLPPITNPGSVNFNVTVGSEDMGVTNIVGNTLTVVRGVNGTTPAISAVGTTVSRSRISAPLSFNASALEIQRALESLEGIGPGGVRVTGGPIPQAAVQLEFTNQQGGFNHPAVVVNNSQLSNGSLLVTTVGNGGISMARPGGRLQVDPGIVVKLNGARIEGERGSSQLIAEGTSIDPIIFTSLKDDRFGGASGSFDSSSDGFQTTSLVGDWGGLMFNVGSRISLDHVYLANAGGQTPIEGGSGSFNPIEIHEATLRLTNSTFEDNTDGASIPGSRNNRETNVPATVFVRGAQSIIVNNVFHNNVGAAISIDANALKAINIVDPGRETGLRDAFSQFADNQGPLVRLNRLQNEILGAGNILGLQVRSGPLDTATVWDDTDIVHVVTAGNISNNYSFHVSGGLRLVSAPNASLVVKLGVGAGFENGNPDSDGNNIPDEGPLDISDRIGAAMQILGAPGFPVIITSLRDDTVGASLDLSGLPHLDTNGDGGASTPASGDWNEILFDKYSNDTNMVVVYESEKALTGGIDVNSAPGTSGSSQFIGDLAPNLKSSNENRRAGFEVHGHISEDASSDVDVYSFSADVGTEVWLDIDNTNPALDTILELVNAAGTVLARSQDNGTLQSFSVTATSLQKTPSLGGDFYATTIRDAGMRIVLPGIAGTSGTYFVRIRSNPVASSINDLQGGLTSGQYQLQLRLQQSDQQPGVAAKFSDIRYATNGLHVRGLPYHSPLTGESGEAGTSDPANDFVAGAIDLGNLLSSDRGSLTAGGALTGNGDIDFYRFRIDYQKIQSIAGVNGGGKTWATVIDLDWADGLTRPDTSFAIFDEVGRLIYIGRDSNVADDQPAAGQGTDVDDLTRGSVGPLDPFINSQFAEAVAPDVFYTLAVVNNQRLPTALNAVFQSGSTNTTVRLEPVNGVTRIAEDHIGYTGYTSNGAMLGTPVPHVGAVNVSSGTSGLPLIDITDRTTLTANVVPLSLRDLTLYTANQNSLGTVNAYDISDFVRQVIINNQSIPFANANTLQDVVMRSDGNMFGYRRLSSNTNNSIAGTFVSIDSATGVVTDLGNDNIPDGTPIDNFAGGATFNDTTTTNEVDALTFKRTGGSTDFYNLFYSVRENSVDSLFGTTYNSKLYRANPNDGNAARNNTFGYGFKGDIQAVGTTPGTGSLFVPGDGTTGAASIRFETRVQGTQANSVRLQVNVSGANVTPNVQVSTNYFTQTVTVSTFTNAGASPPSVQQIVDAINTTAPGFLGEQMLITAAVSGASNGGNTVRNLASGFVTATGGSGTPLNGNVTGLAFDTASTMFVNGISYSGNLYGVTSGLGVAGKGSQLVRINEFTGRATIVRDFSGLGIGTSGGLGSFGSAPFNGTGFQGLSIGPQNLPVIVGTVATAIVGTDTSVTLDTLAPIPLAPFNLIIGQEMMLVTAVSGTTLTVTRTPSVAASHAAGAGAAVPGYLAHNLVGSTQDGRLVAIYTDLARPTSIGDTLVVFDSDNQLQTLNVNGNQTTSTAALLASTIDTLIPVADASVFAAFSTPFDIQIGLEVMTVTNVNTMGNVLTVTRAINGTVAATHLAGDSVYVSGGTFTLTVDDGIQLSTTAPIAFNAPASVSRDEIQTIDDSPYSSGTYTLDFVNNLFHTTALAATLPASTAGTSELMTVQDGSLFPVATAMTPYIIRVEGEDLRVTAHTMGSDLFTVTRGAHLTVGTAVPAHAGDITTGGIIAPATVFEVLTTTVDTILPAAPQALLSVALNLVVQDVYLSTVPDVAPAVAATFPAVPFTIRIDNEEMLVTALTTDMTGTFFTVTRAQNMTTAASHVVNSVLSQISGATVPLTLSVTDVTSFPAFPFTIRVDNEDLRVIAVDPVLNDFTVIRGYNGTNPGETHALGATVFRIETTASLPVFASAAQIQFELNSLPSILGSGGSVVATGTFPVSLQFTGGQLGKRDLQPLRRDPSKVVADESQFIQLASNTTSGQFRIQLGALQTGLLNFDDTAAEVQLELEQLAGVGVGNVIVTGGPLPFGLTIDFVNLLQDTDIPLMQVIDVNLRNNEVQQVFIGGTPTFGSYTLNLNDLPNGISNRSVTIFAADSLANIQFRFNLQYGAGQILIAGFSPTFYTVEFIGTLADKNIAAMTITANSLSGGMFAPTVNVGTQVNGNIPNVAVTTVFVFNDGAPILVPSATRQDGILSVLDALTTPTGVPLSPTAFNPTNVTVAGGPLPGGSVNITLTGLYQGLSLSTFLVNNRDMVAGVTASIQIEGTPGDGAPDTSVTERSGATGLFNNRGLAFSPLDINLWHPTVRRGDQRNDTIAALDPGHGVPNVLDNTRTPTSVADGHSVLDGRFNSRFETENQGGTSLYFGLEEFQSGGLNNLVFGQTAYLNSYYQTFSGGQYGVVNANWQSDLQRNANLRNNYNAPGGALGKLVTNSVDLSSYASNDKPVLYFNYFLNTEDTAASTVTGQIMRDSARVFASSDGGVTWQMIATNNSTLTVFNGPTAELPLFLSDSSSYSGSPIQELYETSNWRQARVDLSQFAGQADVKFRFDFSTAGKVNEVGLPGEQFGNFNGFTGVSSAGQNNAFEGFYVDDLIVGLAERGEMVTNAPPDQTGFDDLYAALRTNIANLGAANTPSIITTGPYQLEIRRGTEYAAPAVPSLAALAISQTFDSNDRLIVSQSVSPPAAVETFDFAAEFDPFPYNFTQPAASSALWTSSSSLLGTSNSYKSGVIVVGQTSSTQLAVTTGAGTFSFEALVDAAVGNTLTFLIDSVPQTLSLSSFGFISQSFSVTAGAHIFEWQYAKTNPTVTGQDAAFIDNVTVPQPRTASAVGDQNMPREQGMVVLEGNRIRDVSGTGIIVEAGIRDAGGTNLPYPGVVRQTPVLSGDRLATGTAIINNVVAGFGTAGIRFSGDNSAAADPLAAVPMGKIINNTVFGGGVGLGIVVSNNASPTIANNIVASTLVGISIDVSSGALASPPDVSANLFQSNVSNGTQGTNFIIGVATSPLFVNAAAGNFYLAPSLPLNTTPATNPNRAIDSALNTRVARSSYTSVTGPLGIPQQDIFAPEIDLFGQKRLDDSFTASAGGLGSNIFKDRGAIERADFSGPTAIIIVPLDNQTGVDLDPALTRVALDSPDLLNQFVIKLIDTDPSGANGVGVDDSLAGLISVNGGTAFTITQIDASNFQNVPAGRVLIFNTDYTYSYNSNTNEAVFTSVTEFPSEARYTIVVDAAQIQDIAANLLQPNQLDGSTQFNILVTNGVNDPPTNNVPSGVTINENSVALFSTADNSALSVSDPDAFISTNTVEVTLTASNGLLSLPANFATLVMVTAGSALNSSTVTFRGTIPNVNTLLAGGTLIADKLRFVPTLNYNTPLLAGTLGNAVLTITTDDLGNFSASLPLDPETDSDNILITVNPVNSAPSVTTPAAVSTNEDVNFTFTGAVISVADLTDGNGGTQQVTVTVTNGLLSLNPASLGMGSPLVFVTGDGTADSTITFQGTLPQLNAAINGLIYIPTPDFNGIALLDVTVNDQGNTGLGVPAPLTATGRTTITVGATNDVPVNRLNGSTTFTSIPFATLERMPYVFNAANGSLLSVTDIDVRDAMVSPGVMQVTLTATQGTLTLPDSTGLSFTVGDGIVDTTMTFTGPIDTVNLRLNGLIFNPNTLFTTLDPLAGVFATVTITSDDQGRTGAGVGTTDTDFVNLNVRPINDPPVITVTNTAEAVNEDPVTPFVFSTASGNPITIAENALDPAPAADFQVRLSVTNGTLTLATTTGLTFAFADIYGTGAGDGTADLLIVFQGNLSEINAALNGLQYSPNPNFNGSDTVMITVNDRDQTGAGGTQTDVEAIALTVNSTNDAPVIAAPVSANATENTDRIFSAADATLISISDLDDPTSSGAGSYQVTLTASAGLVTLNVFTGLTFTVGDGDHDSTMTFTGTIAAINSALNGLFYSPVTDQDVGTETLTIDLDDQGNIGSGGGLTDSKTINIPIDGNNDAPVNSVPTTTQLTREDTAFVFNATNSNLISVSDPDVAAGSLRVTLTTTNGTSTLSTISGLVFTAGDGTADAAMTFAGTLVDINAALDGLTFLGALDYAGLATVRIVTSDLGNTGLPVGVPLIDTDVINLSLSAVNDPPTVNTQQSPILVNEDSSVVMSAGNANRVSINDVDLRAGQARVTLTVTKGVLTLSRVTGLTFSPGSDGTNDSSMTFIGTSLTAINLALDGMIYRPNAGVNGSETLTVIVNDLGNTGDGPILPQQTTRVIDVTINAVNDAPTLTLPGLQTTSEDIDRVFSTSTGNAIQVADVDVNEGTGLMQVALTVTNGTLALGTTNNITVIAGANNSSTVTIRGPINNLNIALNGLAYRTTAEFSGSATLSVSTSDLGNLGSGGVKTASGTVAITISSVNDSPVNTVPSVGPAINEDSSITLAGLNAISVADVDAGVGQVQVMLGVTNGTLTLASLAGLTFVAGDGTGDTTMTFRGPISALNSSLTTLRFQPTANFAGGAVLTVTTSDQGNTGGGGVKTDTDSFSITVNGINDLPVGVVDSYSVLKNGVLITTDIDGTADASVINNGVLANDTDVDSSRSLWTATLVTPPAFHSGAFTLNPNGTFTYSHNGAGSSGTDTFTYRISDGTATNPTDVTVTIDINDPPVITNPGVLSIDENSTIGTQLLSGLTASDANGNAIVFSIVGGNTGGAFAINPTTGRITVASAAALNFETTPSITLTVQATDNAANPGISSEAIVINLNDVSEAVTISSTTWTNAGLTLKLDPSGTLLRVVTSGTDNNAFVEQHVLSKVTSVAMTARNNAADRLTIDFSNGNPIPAGGVNYNGGSGTGSDTLELTSGPIFQTIAHNFASASSGTVSLTSGLTTSVVTYSGLEPIIDSLSATNRVFTYGALNDNVTLSDNVAGDGLSRLVSPGTGETVDFVVPTESLTISLVGGNDLVTVSSIDSAFVGALSILAGDGNDIVTLANVTSPLGAFVDGGIGDDVLTGGQGRETLLGGAGADVLNGGAGNDVLNGGAGADILTGGSGTNVLNGQGDAADIVRENVAGTVTLTGSFVAGIATGELLFGTSRDVLTNTEVVDLIGSAGADLITMSGWLIGPTFVHAGAGNDTVTGSPARDEIYGEADSDIITAGEGNDLILGGAGNDNLQGNGGDDNVMGEDGADVIRGGAGNDNLTGGAGADVIDGQGSSGDIIRETISGTVILSNASLISGTGPSAVTDTILGVESAIITGSGLADRIDARNWSGPTTISAGAGNDTILGGSGFDRIFGGLGNDKISGNGSVDQIYGDEGNDSLDGGAGDDFISGGIDNDTIRGGIGNDKLFGNAGNDSMLGSAGNDSMAGGDGADTIVGEDGNDTVRGEAASDLLVGSGNGFARSTLDVLASDLSDTFALNGIDEAFTSGVFLDIL